MDPSPPGLQSPWGTLGPPCGTPTPGNTWSKARWNLQFKLWVYNRALKIGKINKTSGNLWNMISIVLYFRHYQYVPGMHICMFFSKTCKKAKQHKAPCVSFRPTKPSWFPKKRTSEYMTVSRTTIPSASVLDKLAMKRVLFIFAATQTERYLKSFSPNEQSQPRGGGGLTRVHHHHHGSPAVNLKKRHVYFSSNEIWKLRKQYLLYDIYVWCIMCTTFCVYNVLCVQHPAGYVCLHLRVENLAELAYLINLI